ncbi:ABC transporter substrate-binding protein [Rhizobium rhizosphaerae]|uniref:ABC transporter substrate-binding protein n=1 Tax=Xaviernesmea rhizosphaerae TaxID=1672749 RepID=A0A1Q9AHP4_9HYPH|nr:extracellular solute-binding protein [Xaviernesmea rhizosphaerae]OLP54721.1 ABC transporter substrate-binding protein [Xaviernesmea rhizosphaerae]
MTSSAWKRTLAASLLAATALATSAVTGRAADITLRALMEDVPETRIIEALLPEFTEKTGIKVEFEKIGYPDMHDKLVTQLVSAESAYNLLEVDFLWAGEFPAANWLVDLKPMADASKFDTAPFIPSMLDLLGRTADKMPLVPMYNYSMGLIYRTDLISDEKLKAAYKQETGKDLALPQTLEDYVAIAKFMKAKAGVEGAAMQGQRGDPNAMEFSNYLFSAGGRYLNDDRTVALDSPEARKALDLYVDNIKNGAQQGALSATLDDTLRLMCSGKAFSMVTYWWMLPQIDDAKACPAAAGKVALSVMPGGHGESGGWGWGIPANVPEDQQKAAWTFIQWVQSKEIAVKRALQGHAPVRSDVFADPAVLAKYPFYKTAEAVVASGKSFPIFTYSAEFENVLGTQISTAASGGTSTDEAVKASAAGLKDLMSR